MQVSNEGDSLPFGLIFSTFMVCSMAGSSLFSICNDYLRLEHQALFVLALAALSMVMLLVTTDQTSQYTAMNLFEFTIGMYFPVIGCLKSAIVPESQRAAVSFQLRDFRKPGISFLTLPWNLPYRSTIFIASLSTLLYCLGS